MREGLLMQPFLFSFPRKNQKKYIKYNEKLISVIAYFETACYNQIQDSIWVNTKIMRLK